MVHISDFNRAVVPLSCGNVFVSSILGAITALREISLDGRPCAREGAVLNQKAALLVAFPESRYR